MIAKQILIRTSYFVRATNSKYRQSILLLRTSATYTSSRLEMSVLFGTSSSVSSKIRVIYDNIVKSQEDARLYRGMELTNGMKVLLISDHTTDKSSAALDVNIGYMSDPNDLPGLAHFCEHMLFLGTEKYPEENQYSKFLSEHGGSSNAFTSSEHTNYYFDVAPEHLTGALDRFSQFFVAPLFTTSCTDREVKAVNSENDKNLQNDSWRLHHLDRVLCNSEHDFAKFGTGNQETLDILPKQRNQNVHEELRKFHSKFYSANIMSVAVLGKESLDELSELVVQLFGEVQNKNVVVPQWLDHPCTPEQLKTICHVVPIKDIRSLKVSWPIHDLHPYYKTSPGHYLGHLIGHEGRGSLLSELKKRGWVNTLVGGEHEGAKGFMFFGVNVDLTEEGIDHVNDIITLIYQYVNMLRKEGPQEWVFRECQSLSAMGFRFKDKENPSSYTCHCAASLHDYPLLEVLSAAYFHDEYKPELINMVMEKLTPDNMRLTVVGQKFGDVVNLTEKWYGTSYTVKKLSTEEIGGWSSAGLNEAFSLPDRNEFIPKNFDLLKRDEEPMPMPVILRNSKLTRLWYKQDDKFLLPKACISIDFNSPYAYMDPLSANLTYMFAALLKDALNEYTYAAELAGLGYDIHSSVYGLEMNIGGYNDNQHVLLEKILDKMMKFEIDKQRFTILLENYVRALKNFRAESPYQHAIYYTNMLTSEVVWTKDELLDATDEMTVEKLQSFISHLFSQLFIEMLVYGNVDKDRALLLADIVERRLTDNYQTRPLLPSQRRRFREVQLPDGECYLYRQNNEVHKSSSLEVYYQCTTEETHSNMLLELFCQIISEPCFEVLRTQEQLGYIVFSGVRRSNGVQGLRVIVQSDRSPEYVESRVEAFLNSMEAHIEDMSSDIFDKHVHALATKRLEKPKKLSSQNNRYLSEITSQQYNFDRAEIEVKHLKTLGKEDVLKFYKELLAHDAPRRHKLAVHVVSTVTAITDKSLELNGVGGLTGEGEAGGEEEGEGEEGSVLSGKQSDLTDGFKLVRAPAQINDVITFKRDLGLFPLPKPYCPVDVTNNLSKL